MLYAIILIFMISLSLIIDVLFIGPKLFVILNLEIDTAISVAMSSERSKRTNLSGSEKSVKLASATNISSSERSLKMFND